MSNRLDKKILLLNPPGKDQYFRDYYCAKVSKAKYYYHPVDLVYLSGRLSEFGQVKVIDAIAGVFSESKCLEFIKELEPDIIISLCSAPSYDSDIRFLSKVSELIPHANIIVSGDICRDYRKRILYENLFLNAVLLDFSTDDICTYLKNESSKVISNIIYRKGDEIIEGFEHHSNGIEWSVQLPLWDEFDLSAYSFPFARRRPFASILTDFGCPYNCDFCPVSTLGYKLRPIAEVIVELQKLYSLGVRELYVRDQTFGVNKKRSLELLKAIRGAEMKFSWTALTRTDILDVELLDEMHESGCHTLMLGLESANDEILSEHKKNTKFKEAEDTVMKIKKSGIRVGGFFMLGFPGESKNSIEKTIEFACRLPVDYASFNIVSPRFGTTFRQKSIDEGVVDPSNLEVESSVSMPIWKNQQFSNLELLGLRQKAVKKFYLRPSYLLRRFFGIRSLYEFRNLVGEGLSLLRKS